LIACVTVIYLYITVFLLGSQPVLPVVHEILKKRC